FLGFFYSLRPPPSCPLFPYTTLFRSGKNSARLAPLMLLPVRLEKGKLNPKTATFDYEVLYTGEDILTNLSLREKLRRDFGIALRSESTRLNSSHGKISYAVYCLKKNR